MRILFYISTLNGGGAARAITTLANCLVRTKECTMVTSYGSETAYRLIESVKRIVICKKRNKSVRILENIYIVIRLRHIIEDEKPDVIISFMSESNYRVIIASLFLDTSIICSIRTDPAIRYSSFAYNLLAKTMYPLCDHMVFQTVDSMFFFSDRIQRKSSVLYNLIDEKFFSQYSGDRKNIVSVGRLNKGKNHELLIQAFIDVADIIRDNLVIYGEGEQYHELMDLITSSGLADRITLAGNVDDIESQLIDAKLFVLTSNYEGMPNALMEAMALGVPCISTDCPSGGPRRLFSEYADKYLFPVNDVSALKKLMIRYLLCDEELVIASNDMKELSLRFHPSKVLLEWNRVIETVGMNNPSV